MPESVVKFVEGDLVRVLRGTVSHEDAQWVTVQRRDAVYRINRASIILIETPEVGP